MLVSTYSVMDAQARVGVLIRSLNPERMLPMSAEEDIRRTIANSYDLNDWAPMESVLARREALGSREDVPKDCG